MRLLESIRPLLLDEQLAPQLIHGDLSGNVLLHDDHPPAVIDMSPYWRPAAYADAIIVIDALLWWNTHPDLVRLAQPRGLDADAWRSLLARALIFRLLAYNEAERTPNPDTERELQRYEPVVYQLTPDSASEVWPR